VVIVGILLLCVPFRGRTLLVIRAYMSILL